ncbi:siderophore-interacting protein [Qipengyuania spongiae]|uniref:Siderophore-interacting protein n=1 Tax=Qipengyuania spongiae TaxID=2909673 RepID=A0ABY5SYL7_9SPHN|nr:siderophore-interacting protein [Qipengyuania spongiae]
MLRVTLGGPGLVGFPSGQKGGYVKLMLPPPEGRQKPTVRTYTIRDQRSEELDIDFAMHADDGGEVGPATRWALTAQPGDRIEVGGPGAAKPLPSGFDHYLVAGDMTALPAISANLEAFSADASGFVVLEVQDDADRQDLVVPSGFEIRWLVNPQPGARPDLLEQALREFGWPGERTYAWAACEFSGMARLRTYLRKERGLGPSEFYLSSYWKSGLAEEAHKIAKREDAEANAVLDTPLSAAS